MFKLIIQTLLYLNQEENENLNVLMIMWHVNDCFKDEVAPSNDPVRCRKTFIKT